MVGKRRNIFILLFVLGLTVVSAIAILSKPTRLGLDLRGGIELVYQAQPTPQQPEVTPEAVDRAIEIIRQRTDVLGVSEPEIARVGADQITVGLPDIQDVERAVEQVGTTAQLHFYDWEPNVISRDPGDPNAADQGFNRLIDAVRLASRQDRECWRDQCTTNGPQLYLFDRNTFELKAGPEPTREDLLLDFGERQPEGTIILKIPQGTLVVEESPTDDPGTEADESETGLAQYFVLRDRPELSGTDITSPEQSFDPQTNQPIVTFNFTDEGRQKFHEVTRRIAQRGLEQSPPGISPEQAAQFSDHFAVVLDDEVVSRPIIDFVENPDGIDGRTGAQISGGFTIQEAQDLAEFLRIGALPLELKLISQSTVSATLGQEALEQGLKAGIAGLIIVLLFLIAFYRVLGVVAALGLLTYAVFFFALIKLIPITLTLPGIAGLILTIGVAADTNIVIFERIKEEARAGRSMASAISQGYKKGLAAIIDANVITLITAFILFVLATAGVKGFAFTLGVGTLVSLFTAIVFTQAILGTFGRGRLLESPKLFGAGPPRARWHLDFAGMSKWFFSMSGVILAVGAVSFATNQLNFGIDFESGTRLRASLAEEASVEQVRRALADAGVPDAGGAEIQEVEDPEFGPNVFGVQTRQLEPEGVGAVRSELEDRFGLQEAEAGEEGGFQSESVGPTFGEQVARSAVYAIAFSLLLICAYVAIRFQPKFAVPVIIAVSHDLLLTAGVYSLAGREVSSATVAALLTIIGYSLYDTVIVFDRVRENLPRMPRAAFSQVVNRSLSEVLTRSLLTGLSTAFVILMLLLFGGETLKDFAFAMLVGIATGAYSSIFIAAPVLTAWKEREPGFRLRRARIEEATGHVPAFAEDNVVMRTEPEEVERAAEPPPREPAAPAAAAPSAGPDGSPPEPARPVERDGGAATGAARGDGPGARPHEEAQPLVGAEPGEPRRERPSKRARRRQRRRRKHGRHR